MKKILSILVFASFSIIAFCQSKGIIQPQLEGYQQNDLVKYDDFIKNGKLTVNNKEYNVVGFTLMVWAGVVQEYKSDSCTITDEMKKILTELKSKGFKTSKIYFHDIKIKNSKGKIKTTGDLFYKLKLD